MKKSILDFGKTLSKDQQKKIVGGARICDHRSETCYEGSAPSSNLNQLVIIDSEGVYHIY